MKKRTPEEKYLKEIEDIREAAAAVEAIKKIIREALSKIKEKLAEIIKMFHKKKKTGVETPELRKRTPPPPQPFILSSDGNKTPFDDKITEAKQELRGERLAYLQQHYKIEGVDLAEAEPEQWPKENPTIPKLATGGIIDRATLAMIGTRAGEREEIIPLSHEVKNELVKFSASVGELFAGLRNVAAAWASLVNAVCAYSERAAALENYPNKRVVHLAKHAKKKRVRKKNINRIKKWAEREGR